MPRRLRSVHFVDEGQLPSCGRSWLLQRERLSACPLMQTEISCFVRPTATRAQHSIISVFMGLLRQQRLCVAWGERSGALDNMLSQWNKCNLTPTWLAAVHGHYEIVERIWTRVEHHDSAFPPKLGPLMLVRRNGSTLLHLILSHMKSSTIPVAKLTVFLRSVLTFADRADITLMLLDAMNSENMTPMAIAQRRYARDAAFEASCQVLQEAAARENASLARRVVALILRAVASTQ